MEGRHADIALKMEQMHSFRDQIIAEADIVVNLLRELFKTTNIIGVYMTYVTIFDNRNMLRESTFNCLLILLFLCTDTVAAVVQILDLGYWLKQKWQNYPDCRNFPPFSSVH